MLTFGVLMLVKHVLPWLEHQFGIILVLAKSAKGMLPSLFHVMILSSKATPSCAHPLISYHGTMQLRGFARFAC